MEFDFKREYFIVVRLYLNKKEKVKTTSLQLLIQFVVHLPKDSTLPDYVYYFLSSRTDWF